MKLYIKSAEEILAMSKNQMKLASDLEDVTRPIVEHLIKLRLYPNTEFVTHWRSEIASFLCEVPVFKHNKHLPSAEFIVNNTIGVDYMLIRNLISVVISNMDSLIPAPFDYDELVDDIVRYFKWLATNLSKTGKIARNTIFEMLKNLNF